MTHLFSSLTLGDKTLKNRLVVAPMTTTQSHPDGRVSHTERVWLERLATDGYGAIITCAAAISRTSTAFRNQLSLGDDRLVDDLTALADSLRARGTLSIVQLCHGGSRALPALTGVPAHSASAYERPGVADFIPPRELSTAQIAEIVDDFASATERAALAGFDGIELHGANGYLFTQFLSTMTNRRTDAYGGPIENRARFAREVVRACRRRVPDGFILGFRMSFESNPSDTGLDLDDNALAMRWLAEDGITYGHVSHLNAVARSVRHPAEVALPLIRDRVGPDLPLFAAGSVMSREDADHVLALGADVVAIGRGAIGNADVPGRFARSEPLTKTPYAADSLPALAVSDDFLRYLTSAVPVSSLGIVAGSPAR